MPTAPACSLRKGEVNILQTSQRWLRLALGTPGEGLVVKFMMISELGSEFEPRALWSTTHPIPETLAGPWLGTRASLLSLRGGRWLHCKTKVGEEPSSRDMGQAVQGWGSQRNTPWKRWLVWCHVEAQHLGSSQHTHVPHGTGPGFYSESQGSPVTGSRPGTQMYLLARARLVPCYQQSLFSTAMWLQTCPPHTPSLFTQEPPLQTAWATAAETASFSTAWGAGSPFSSVQ